MKDGQYDRSVEVLCPTCGCSQFEFEKTIDEVIELAKCASCGREITKDELLNENSENINEHVKEMAEEIKNDLLKELRKSFGGNKNFRIK